ncbi:hypothetical protein HQ585_17290 [candidate division KSB1 bacterium]|nr:hypothetical protein [candidate division KSB1 bacterium]
MRKEALDTAHKLQQGIGKELSGRFDKIRGSLSKPLTEAYDEAIRRTGEAETMEEVQGALKPPFDALDVAFKKPGSAFEQSDRLGEEVYEISMLMQERTIKNIIDKTIIRY